MRQLTGLYVKHKAIRHRRGAMRLTYWKPRLALRIPLVGHIRVLKRCGWWWRWYVDGIHARPWVLRARCGIDGHFGAVIKTVVIIKRISFWLVKGSVVAETNGWHGWRIKYGGPVLT